MNKRNGPSAVLSALLTFSVLTAACTSNSGAGGTPNKAPDAAGKAGDATSAKAKEPTNISIMTTFNTKEPPGPDNVIVKEVEKRTNTNLKITWVHNDYNDKVNVTVASGDIPDLLMVNDPLAGNFPQLIKDGAFWDLTPYIKDYPNLSTVYPKQVWENSKVFGKNYGIVRARSLYGLSSILVRKDWVDKLHLKMPETLDDLYNVLKAFKEGDPDGNGKNDTIPFTGYVDTMGMGRFQWVNNMFNESNGKWKAVDGKLVDTTLEPGSKDALLWLKKAYDEQLISPDFAVLKDSQNRDAIASNKAGATEGAVSYSWVVGGEARKVDPKADLVPLPYLTNTNGKKILLQDSGVFGMYLIPKTVPEEKMKQILKFMDYGASEEGATLANYGFKDVHYTEQDGFKIGTEQALKDNVAQQAFGQVYTYYDPYFRAYATGIPKEKYEDNKKVIDEMASLGGIADPTVGLYSPTDNKLGAEYEKTIMDIRVKVIMGKEPVSAWDNLVAKLKADSNYQKIIQEMNQAYQEKLGK